MFNQPKWGEWDGKKNYTLMKNFSYILSLLAFAFSIMAFFGINGDDTGNGILALIGICTTLIVGVNVVDSLRVQKIEKQIEELDDMRTLKADLNKLKQDANIALKATWGISLIKMAPKKAIQETWGAIRLSLIANEASKLSSSYSVMGFLINSIEKDSDLSCRLIKECEQEIPIKIAEEIKGTELYTLEKEKLDKYIKKIESIIKITT